MKWLIKLVMPSAKTLSGYAADGIAKAVNESGKTDAIAKYSLMLQTAATNIASVNEMLVDGKIDPTETKRIAEMLTPAIDNILKMI